MSRYDDADIIIDLGKKLVHFGKNNWRVREAAVKIATRAIMKCGKEQARATYYVKAAELHKAFSVRLANGYGEIIIRGHRMNMIDFRLTPRRFKNPQHGIRVGIRRDRGMHRMRHGFVMPAWQNGPIIGFRREDGECSDEGYFWFDNDDIGLHQLTTLAIPQMVSNPEIQAKMIEAGEMSIEETIRGWHFWH